MRDNQPSEFSLESKMFTKLQTEQKKKINCWIGEKNLS